MRREEIFDTLCAADAAQQQVIAEAIKEYPHVALYDYPPRVEKSATSWASTTVEAAKHFDMAHYLTALAWFYAEVKPTNAMAKLIEAKSRLIKRGKDTDAFWKFLEAVAVSVTENADA